MVDSLCLIFILVFAVIDDTTKEIVYRDYVDISVAVATPKVRQTGAVKGECTQVGNGSSLRAWWFLSSEMWKG